MFLVTFCSYACIHSSRTAWSALKYPLTSPPFSFSPVFLGSLDMLVVLSLAVSLNIFGPSFASRLRNPKQPQELTVASDSLRHRIVSSIIKEHLDAIGCVYSSSGFAAESGCDEKILSRGEVGEILSLAVPDEGMTSMEYLVEKAPGRRGIMHNTEVQTTHVEGSRSLEQKFAVPSHTTFSPRLLCSAGQAQRHSSSPPEPS